MAIATTAAAAGDSAQAQDPRTFSIVLGGPLYQLLRRAHVSGDALQLARRPILALAPIPWLPPLVLAFLGSSNAVAVTFAGDIEVHVRFLVAVPLLVAA